MEVKPGYKQTEVGVIPEEWDVKPLGEIGGVRMCKRVLKHQTREHGEVPFYKIGTFGGLADAFITQSLFDEFRRKYSFPRKGDVLISAAGTIGRTVVYDGVPAYFQDSNIVWIDNDESKATNAYLWHRYQVTKWSVSHGGTVARLYNDNLRNKIHIPVPPLPEQHAIATALSDVDGLLGGLDRLIAKKRDLKQAAMQQLLTGQTRLPGFTGEWEVKMLGDSIDLLTGFPFPSADYCDAGIRLLRGSNVKRGVTDWSDDLVQCWPRMTSDIARYELQEGDLVIAMDGSLVGRSYARLQTQDLPAVLLQRVARIRSTKLDIGYLTQFVGSDIFISYCDSVKTVTAIPHISPSDIRNFRIPVPPDIKEQTAIAEVLTAMDAELAVLEQRRDKTRALKQAIMQELLTGRTRLV